MWPLDLLTPSDWLHCSRRSVERWGVVSQGRRLISAHELDQKGSPSASELADGMKAVLKGAQGARIELMLDTCWLPLLLLDTGESLLSADQLDALVRHRLGLLYTRETGTAGSWATRVDHQAGERYALGTGLSSDIDAALRTAAQTVGVRWGALLPSFAWAWRQLRPDRIWPRSSGGKGWFVWRESDRTLIGLFERGRLAAFNPGAPPSNSDAEIDGLIAAETLRWGLEPRNLPVTVASWSTVDAPGGNATGRSTRWIHIASDAGAWPARSGVEQAAEVPA